MEEIGNNQANIDGVSVAAGGRPGKPKGHPKPLGSGRKKGTPNRATRDVRAAAAKHSAKAIASLVKLLADPDPKVVAIAAREILDRAHGRPMTASELTGRNGEPLIPQPEMSDRDAARRIQFLLTRATRPAPVGVPSDDIVTILPKPAVIPLAAPNSEFRLGDEEVEALFAKARREGAELQDARTRPDQRDYSQQPAMRAVTRRPR